VTVLPEGLVKKVSLSGEDLKAIRELADVVEASDGIRMKLNWEMLRERPGHQVNDFLYYADGRLIGFLGIYIIVPGESELSGMVHPDYRRQGIFTKMVTEALDLLQGRGTKVVIYICARSSESGAAFLKNRGVPYTLSEYLMDRKDAGNETPPSSRRADLHLREARLPEDIKLLAELNALGFDMPLDEAEGYALATTGPSEITYIVESDGFDVGKLGVQLEDGTAFIFGFCVRPENRGQGIGRAALAETLRLLQQERRYRHFQLEVEVANEGALGLYESVGFRVINILDYYKQPILTGRT
jgi:ribosomal protein S18 acetylase RimI-like enzyme